MPRFLREENRRGERKRGPIVHFREGKRVARIWDDSKDTSKSFWKKKPEQKTQGILKKKKCRLRKGCVSVRKPKISSTK